MPQSLKSYLLNLENNALVHTKARTSIVRLTGEKLTTQPHNARYLSFCATRKFGLSEKNYRIFFKYNFAFHDFTATSQLSYSQFFCLTAGLVCGTILPQNIFLLTSDQRFVSARLAQTSALTIGHPLTAVNFLIFYQM